MSEQPLFDVDALRKIDAQPGDVFVLELSEEYDTPTVEEAARIGEEIRSFLGDVKVMVLQPGMRLEKLSPDLVFYLESPDVDLATAEEIDKIRAKFLERYQGSAVQWHGNTPSVVRADDPTPSLKEANAAHAQTKFNAVGNIHYPPLAEVRAKPRCPLSWLDETIGSGHPCPEFVPLRVTWQGKEIPVESPMWFGWSASKGDEWTCQGAFRGGFSRCPEDGAEVLIFNPSTNERFRAIVKEFKNGFSESRGFFSFRSVGLPAHAAEATEPQADEPHKIIWKEWL